VTLSGCDGMEFVLGHGLGAVGMPLLIVGGF
jgi:hypothetical protein